MFVYIKDCLYMIIYYIS